MPTTQYTKLDVAPNESKSNPYAYVDLLAVAAIIPMDATEEQTHENPFGGPPKVVPATPPQLILIVQGGSLHVLDNSANRAAIGIEAAA